MANFGASNVVPFPNQSLWTPTEVSVVKAMNTSQGIDLCSRWLEEGFWEVEMPFRTSGGVETSFSLHFIPRKASFVRTSMGVEPSFDLHIECRMTGTPDWLYNIECTWSPVRHFVYDRVILNRKGSLMDLYAQANGLFRPQSEYELLNVFANGVSRHLNEGLKRLLGKKTVAGVGLTPPGAKDTFPEAPVETDWSVLD